MSADILDGLERFANGGYGDWSTVASKAIARIQLDAAEIGRLRGEVARLEGVALADELIAVATRSFGGAIAPAEAKDPAPAMPNGVEGLLSQARAVLERFRAQDDDAATVINRIDALRAADNRDAAGVVPAWIATWMADREILPDDDGDGISEGALVEALNNHERELLNAHHSACELGAVRIDDAMIQRGCDAYSAKRMEETGEGESYPEGMQAALTAALQHRGDSRGGEG